MDQNVINREKLHGPKAHGWPNLFRRHSVAAAALLSIFLLCGNNASGKDELQPVPPDINAIFNHSAYASSAWGLRVVDLASGRVLIDLNPDRQFYIGSVRKAFVLAELLNQVGPDRRYDTPVYRQGTVNSSGVLKGNLIVVPSGDLTMGGRLNPDGSIAFTALDHNEANSVGQAILTAPDPLAGYAMLARQVAASGIREVRGDVAIDDRLFQFNFRDEFTVTPAFVNDDVVDLSIRQGANGMPPTVKHRPVSSALAIDNELQTGAAGSELDITLDSADPVCIGQPACSAKIAGVLPADYVPAVTNQYPLVRTIRITNPANYARTIFIEQLRAAGVKVHAPAVEENPKQILPRQNSYARSKQVASLVGTREIDNAKLVMKVSYNIGSDTSLILWGLTQNVNTIEDSLALEKNNLATVYGIQPSEYNFVDGSGGGETTATSVAVLKMLAHMYRSPLYSRYFDTMPSLGVDGSLEPFRDFEADPTLKGAAGRVHAKTGTYVGLVGQSLVLKGQALAGYVNTKSGKRLAFSLVVNNVPVNDVGADVLPVFQDQSTIAAILWRDF